MNWRNRWPRLFSNDPEADATVQPQILVLVGRDPTSAEVGEFRSVIRGDTGAVVKDNVGNVLVDIRVSGSNQDRERNA